MQSDMTMYLKYPSTFKYIKNKYIKFSNGTDSYGITYGGKFLELNVMSQPCWHSLFIGCSMDVRLLCSMNIRIYVWMSSILDVSQANNFANFCH